MSYVILNVYLYQDYNCDSDLIFQLHLKPIGSGTYFNFIGMFILMLLSAFNLQIILLKVILS